MYELCALLAAKKTRKVRAVAKPAARIGATAILTINGATVKIVERDSRYKSAFFVADENGNRLPFSFSRDVLDVQK